MWYTLAFIIWASCQQKFSFGGGGGEEWWVLTFI